MPGVVGRTVRAMGLAVSLIALATAVGEASPGAGTTITNTVTAQYRDPSGLTYGAQSNTISVSVASVSGIVVSPKENAVDPATEGFPVGNTITRTFTIANAGNVADAYTVQSLVSAAGSITAIAFAGPSGSQPVTLGSTVSPTLQPGESIAVQVTIATAAVAVGTAFPISIAARSTNASAANGLSSDTGKVWALAQPSATIGGPGGPATTVSKLVNQVRTHTANPGETVTYTVDFKNYGGSAATNVVLTDDLPAGIVALPQTVKVNGVSAAATLVGARLTVKVGSLAAGALDTVSFDAQVQSGTTAGATYVNVASVSADGIAALQTTPASVLVGLGNVVYDGYRGGGSPVNGAVLTLRDFTSKAIVPLPAVGSPSSGSSLFRTPQEVLLGIPVGGLPPNTGNANPFTTGFDGAYSFVFTPGQLGSIATPASYELDIVAPGYRDRRIKVTISPDASGLLYDAVLQQLDEQQLAVPGGFTLVASSVTLSQVFGLLGNVPLFAPHPLSVTKTVDRDVASGGDRLLYTVQVGNQGTQLGTTRVVDTLPSGVAYAPGTARVDGVALEPQRAGRVLTWVLPSLDTPHTITYACVVLPFTAEGATLVNVVDVDALANSGLHVAAAASADTRVVAGALGNRIVITGRVFVDVARTGRFRPGDRGLAGVRIYLEDGSSVTTDQYGRFTFPSVHPGQHVLRIDPSSLPAGVRAYDEHKYDSPRSLQRLLHGVFDAGLMHDVNFALEPA